MRAVALAALMSVVALGWAYWLLAWHCVRLHFRSEPALGASFKPAVSILKPLKGIDPELKENLTSFCLQDYCDYEILIGIRDPSDPAVRVVEELQREFPDCSIRLSFAPDLGVNPKTAILHHLSGRARNPILVISDSDIRVGRDYLQRVVAPLEDPRIGLVTCPYRSRIRTSLVSVMAAMHVDLAFIPAAIVGSCLPGIRYAFGATLAMRAEDLRRCGGYASIADMLGDDYSIGSRVADLGLCIRLSDYLVEHVSGDENFAELWRREVRWSRTVRMVAPIHYAGLLLPLCVLWAIGPLIVSGGAAWAIGVLGATLLLRWLIAWFICAKLGNKPLRRWLIWLPIRDALDGIIWVVGLFGNHIIWRGQTYALRRDGTLVAPHAFYAPASTSVGRWLIRALDGYLRRRDQIFEYSSDAQCLFRISIKRLDHAVVLQDHTRLAAGDRVIDLHFWNEHMPTIGPAGPDMAWAAVADQRVNRSLHELARYLAGHPELDDVAGLRGSAGFMTRSERQINRLVRRYGFEEHGQIRPHTILQHLHRFGDNLLLWALIWTFNPRERKRKKLFRPRYMIWMSRTVLVGRYGSSARSPRRHDQTQPWKRAVPPADLVVPAPGLKELP